MKGFRWSILVSILLLSFSFSLISGTYVFEGDPYEKGPFEVDILKVKSRPFHSVVHYPILAGNYSVQFFLGGYTGFFLARYYSNFLSKIAEHGIIVVGIDTNTFSLLDDSFSKSISSYGISQGVLETLRWLKKNLYYELEEKVRAVKPDFNSLVISGYGSGAEIVLETLYRDCSLFKATILMDPNLFDFETKVNFSLPTLFIGSQFATTPEWCSPSILPYYNLWRCPKTIANITGYGHCALLDLPWFKACWASPECKAIWDNDIETYHTFVAGMNSAWIASYVQGNCDELKYVLDPSRMPLQMEYIYSDFSCQSQNCTSPSNCQYSS